MLTDAPGWYLRALGRFADFDGRAGRRELWAFVGVHGVVLLVLGAASTAVGIALDLPWIASGLVLSVYVAVSAVPTLAVVARRLHDTGRSSLLVLVSLVPVLGLVVLYWLALPGEPAPNAWGQPPPPRPPTGDDWV